MNDNIKESKVLSVWLIVASVVGAFASTMLVVEKISYWVQKADGKLPELGCNINPIVGCGSIINTEQASILGNFPNPLAGVIVFSALFAIAVILLSGVRLPEWIWITMQFGVIVGIAVVTYLQYSSIYTLNALCPYCMVVWAVMIPTFWTVTNRNLKRWFPRARVSMISYQWTALWISLHFLVLITLIWLQFGSKIWA